MDRYAKVKNNASVKYLKKSKSRMHIVSSNTQFRTIFVPRLDKFEMLVKLKITNNLLKSLSTFICEVWQGYPESNREALRHWFLSYLMTLMYNQHSQVILGIHPIIDQLLFCIVNTVKPVQLIFVHFSYQLFNSYGKQVDDDF